MKTQTKGTKMLRTCAIRIQHCLIYLVLALPLASLLSIIATAVIGPQAASAATNSGIQCDSSVADSLLPALDHLASLALGFRKLAIPLVLILGGALLFAVFNDVMRHAILNKIFWIVGIAIGLTVLVGFVNALIGSGC